MQEINRNSKELISSYANNEIYTYIKVNEGEKIVFSSALVLMCNLKLGNYIHFLNDNEEWMFYSNDNKDGFVLTQGNKNSDNLQICSYPLSRMILKSTGFNKSRIFYITKTFMEKHNCPVFKLSTNEEA